MIFLIGRVGPDNATYMHHIFFDNNGYMAHHSAAHDAFGYLQTFHNIGPGYDYLHWVILNKRNMFAGQVSGILFWRDALKECQKYGIECQKII